MQETKIDQSQLDAWADILISHSLGGVDSKDRVMIKGERICWPLMQALERKVIQAGAIPDIYLVPPNNERGRVWSAAMGSFGSREQLQSVASWHQKRYESMTKYIEVLGAEDPSAYSGLDGKQAASLASADRAFANLRLAKPWVLTLYPTPGFAQMEGMDLQEYTDFIVNASTTDPRPLKEAEQRIAPLMESGNEIEIVTSHPDGRQLRCTMDLSFSHPVMSFGLRNFPDGEVFTSPDASSVQGEIFIDLPVHYSGVDIQGIYLKLKSGKIVEYHADKGHEQLTAIIETDEGSHRLGEVALGMNSGMNRVLKHPLFVEKVGGTLHIAIGQSYEDCYVQDPSSAESKKVLEQLEKKGILNRSAQHVDIVCDFRPSGAGRSVKIDKRELVVKDGIWIPA